MVPNTPLVTAEWTQCITTCTDRWRSCDSTKRAASRAKEEGASSWPPSSVSRISGILTHANRTPTSLKLWTRITRRYGPLVTCSTTASNICPFIAVRSGMKVPSHLTSRTAAGDDAASRHTPRPCSSAARASAAVSGSRRPLGVSFAQPPASCNVVSDVPSSSQTMPPRHTSSPSMAGRRDGSTAPSMANDTFLPITRSRRCSRDAHAHGSSAVGRSCSPAAAQLRVPSRGATMPDSTIDISDGGPPRDASNVAALIMTTVSPDGTAFTIPSKSSEQIPPMIRRRHSCGIAPLRGGTRARETRNLADARHLLTRGVKAEL